MLYKQQLVKRASGGIVYALVLETSAARLKSSSLFLPTKIMKIEIQSQKGLRTVLSVVVDKKTIQLKLEERLSELQREVTLKVLDLVKSHPP